MPEIRQTLLPLDIFDGREGETPLAGGWTVFPVDGDPLVLTEASPAMASEPLPSTVGRSRWTPDSWDGDEAEAWAWQWLGGASGHTWSIWLLSDAGVNGYAFTYEVSSLDGLMRMYRRTAGALTLLQTNSIGRIPQFVNGNGIMLIRRKGNDVEGWAMSRDGVFDWTPFCSITDTNYMTGLQMGLGIVDNSSSQVCGWRNPGGGPARRARPLPQYIRRPHRRGSGLLLP